MSSFRFRAAACYSFTYKDPVDKGPNKFSNGRIFLPVQPVNTTVPILFQFCLRECVQIFASVSNEFLFCQSLQAFTAQTVQCTLQVVTGVRVQVEPYR